MIVARWLRSPSADRAWAPVRVSFRVRALILALVACAVTHRPAAAIELPDSFVVESITPGANFNTPTYVAYLPSGRALVAEKRGNVYGVSNGVKNSTPLLNLQDEILNNGDRGLLSIAVDPNYVTNRFIYLLYTVDPDSNGSDTNDDAFGRLTRYQVSASDSNAVVAGSRTILMGVDWRRGVASGSSSHTVGGLNWGRDGSLLVSTGDGASFDFTDAGGLDPNLFGPTKTDPLEDIGAFRAQYLGSLCGKLLRLNPATGQGYPSNPFWDGNGSSVRSRVWAYGLRNPFRFTVRPGTGSTNPADGNPGTIYICDVGWATYEDQNLVTAGGRNFGWPCYEGPETRSVYLNATPAHSGCGTIGTSGNPSPHTPPYMYWNHDDAILSSPPGLKGNANVGGVFYTGSRYPNQYRGYFFGDYGQRWMNVAHFNASQQLTDMLEFAYPVDRSVCFTTEPISGDVVYVAIMANEVQRIRYIGTILNQPPVAVATAPTMVGAAPFTASLSSAGSSDPNLDPLAYSWLFGDGQGATGATAQHTYTNPGVYDAILTVDDGQGGIGRDTVRVVARPGVFPTSAVLDNFNRPDGAVGGAWVDQITGLQIDENAAVQTCCNVLAVWNGGVFGPEQEAHVTLSKITASAPEHSLMLKVQGTSYTAGHIEVRYSAPLGEVQVSTFASGAWTPRGAPIPVTFADGDRFGAAAYSNGVIEVYRNGALIGARDAGNWPFKANGGRLGLTLDGATSSRLDNFGGGNVVFTSNTPPSATIAQPADGGFYIDGQTIDLAGVGADAQQSAASLQYEWLVDVHHNNHVHPASFVFNGPNASFVAESHDDGTGVHYGIRLVVTDNGSMSDTTEIEIWPEVDLRPAAVSTAPAMPGTTTPATWSFRLHNQGRMAASRSRWRLIAGTTMLAEGDTLVPALDSVLVVRTLPPLLASGSHAVRVVADTLAALRETDEGNNAATGTVVVVEGPSPDATVQAANGLCSSSVQPVVAVPFAITRNGGAPVRSVGVSFQLDPDLALADGLAGIVEGGYLSSIGTTSFSAVDNGGGSYTVTVAIVGSPCGATAASGTLFTASVVPSGADGVRTLTVTGTSVTSCTGSQIGAEPGVAASLTVDTAGPTGVDDLTATRGAAATAGTREIVLTFATPPDAASVEVWRHGFGGYPQYDEAGGAEPAVPTAYPPPGWTLTGVTASGQSDTPGARDQWFYVVYTRDACGNPTVSNRSAGTIAYRLGDVHDGITDCEGDNTVSTTDISFLGAHYGITIPVLSPLECLDVGPSSNGTIQGRPITDNRTDFEDFILFALDYGQSGTPAVATRAAHAPAAVDALRLRAGPAPAPPGTLEAVLELSGSGTIQGLSADLAYDADVVEFAGAEAGPLLAAQATPGLVLTPRAGKVDVALLGGASGLVGTGDLVRVRFRVRRAGDPRLVLAGVEARDRGNRPVTLGTTTAASGAIPAHSGLAAARPSPFREQTTLECDLARAGEITLGVYGVDGRRVRTLAAGVHPAGVHRLVWDGRDDAGRPLAAGIYWARLTTPDGRFTRTLVRVP